MPIDWGSLFGGSSPAPPKRNGIDWGSLGIGGAPKFDFSSTGLSEEELRQAKLRKLAELQRLAGASDLLNQDDMQGVLDKKRQIQPGLLPLKEGATIDPLNIASRIGERQVAEMGVDTSPRNLGDTLLSAGKAGIREVAELPAMIVRGEEDVYDWLKKKADEPEPSIGKYLAGGVAADPLFYGLRAHRALGDPTGLIGAAQRNPEEIDRATEAAITSAPIPEVGAAIAGMARIGGAMVDPAAGGLALMTRGARAAKLAREGRPLAEMTSALFSKEGGMPADMWQKLQMSKRAGEGADFDAAAAINKVDREIQKEIDTALALESPDRKAELNAMIDQALTSGRPEVMESLPLRLQKPVAAIRERMDKESHQIVRNALFSDEAAAALKGIVRETEDPLEVAQFFRDRDTLKAGFNAISDVVPDARRVFTLSPESFDDQLKAIPDPKVRATLRSAYDARIRMDAFSETLQPEARQALDGLGNHLDSLSPHRRAVADHYLPVMTRIEKNLGTYTRTSYRAFDDPKYAQVLSANEQAEKFENLVKYATDTEGMAPEEAKRWGKTILTEIEQNAAENGRKASLFPEFPEAVKSALLRKRDVPEPIQEFLGINRDWRVGFQRGMVAAAEIGTEIKQWDDLMEQAGGKLFALGQDGRGAVNEAGQALTYKVTKGSRFIAPEGQAIYTSPEIGKILDSANALVKAGTPLYKWQMANSLARFGWTVGNVATHAVNILGDVVLSLKAGSIGSPMTFAREFKHAVGSEFARIAGKVPAEEARELDAFRSAVAKRGGMTTGGAIAEERRHLGSLLGVPSKGIRGKLTPGPEEYLGISTARSKIRNAVKRVTGKGMDYAASMFTAPDQAVRLSHIEGKANQLAKAYPGWSSERVYDEAVERGLNEIPSPEYGPKAIQKLRENFAFGSLITYPTEILRTTWNSFEYALKDLGKALTKTDAELAAEGASRAGLLEMGSRGVAGTLAAVAFVPTVTASAKMALSKVWPDANDPEKMAARKRFMPSYYKDANLMVLGDDKKNNVVFMDWSPIDAYGQMGRAMNSALAAVHDGGDGVDAALAAGKKMIEPYTSMQPLALTGIEALTNRKMGGTGAEIANPEASLAAQAGDYGEHLLKTLAPGPVKTGMRFLEAGQTGDKWIAEREIASWFGLRMYRFDTSKQIEQTARERQKSYVGLMNLRNKAVKTDFLTAGSPAVLAAEEEAQTKWSAELSQEIRKDIEAAKTLGKSDAEIIKLYANANFPKKHVEAILRGKLLPLSWKD